MSSYAVSSNNGVSCYNFFSSENFYAISSNAVGSFGFLVRVGAREKRCAEYNSEH